MELAEFSHFYHFYESDSDKFLDIQNSDVTTICIIPGI